MFNDEECLVGSVDWVGMCLSKLDFHFEHLSSFMLLTSFLLVSLKEKKETYNMNEINNNS